MAKLTASRKRLLKYIFVGVFALWVLTGLYAAYRYVLYTGDASHRKWWTLLEGVFGSVGYLPYASNNQSDFFYQSLLFHSCLHPRWEWDDLMYDEQLCAVESPNNQTYTVTINSGYVWSDGTAVTIDDVFFTFQSILKNNQRERPWLESYRALEVKKLSFDTIQVVFPFESVDNNIFFTNYVLPQHILTDQTYDRYVDNYSRAPVVSNCAKIQETISDVDSLVFDLIECDFINVMFYQLKRFDDFVSFKEYVNANNLIHFYEHQLSVSGYDTQQLIHSDLVTVFFNTQSDLLNARVNRVVGGFIAENFYAGGYERYLYKNHFVFDKFLSTGQNIETILRDMGSGDGDSFELLDIDPLPSSIEITTRDRQFIYSLDEIEEVFNLQIDLDFAYPRIQIVHEDGTPLEPSTYDKNKKVTFYNIKPGQNIKPGHNKYTIYALEKGDDTQNEVATFDIWYITKPDDVAQGGVVDKIDIIYFDEPLSSFVAQRMETMFADAGLADYFKFWEFSSPEEFQGKIASQDYDMVIRSIRRWLKQDMSSLFLTDAPTVNPSLYVNQSLASLITEYVVAQPGQLRDELKSDIDAIYSTNIPFIILGQPYTFVHYNQDLNFGSGSNQYVISFKKDILSNTQLVEHILPNKDKFFTRANVFDFLQTTMFANEAVVDSDLDSDVDVNVDVVGE